MALPITGIIFDIAGVLIALDGVPTMAKLLGVEPDHERLHAMWLNSPSVVAHETGKIDAATFAAGVVQDLNLPTTPEQFLQEFCGWPKTLMPGALELLDEIPDALFVAALSNTSAAHWNMIESMGLVGRFHQTYLSHQIGALKPDPRAFLAALDGIGLPPSEIIFLDDGLRNVEAATKLGMNAHLTKGPAEARSILVQYGVVPSEAVSNLAGEGTAGKLRLPVPSAFGSGRPPPPRSGFL